MQKGKRTTQRDRPYLLNWCTSPWRLRSEENCPEDHQQWDHHRESPFEEVADEGWGRDFAVTGDGADHEVGAVADVGVGAEEDGGDADRDEDGIQFAWAGIAGSDRGCKTGEVCRRIVQNAGKYAAGPIVF